MKDWLDEYKLGSGDAAPVGAISIVLAIIITVVCFLLVWKATG